MLKASIELDRRARIFSKVRNIDLRIELTSNEHINSAKRALFCNKLLSSLASIEELRAALEALPASDNSLLNIRGRPPESFKATQSSTDTARREEVLFADGVVYSPRETPSTIEDYKSEEAEHFTIQRTTQFKDFPAEREIAHALEEKLNGALKDCAELVSPVNLFRLLPVRVDRFRLGLEFYRGRYRGSMLSAAPGVERVIYLEAGEEKISFFFRDLLDKSSGSAPFDDFAMMAKLSNSLESACLFRGLFGKIEELMQQSQQKVKWSGISAS